MVLWDCAPTLGLEEEEPMEEIQLSAVNITTRSKGPIMDESLLLPKIRKIQESMEKISSNTQTPPKSDLVTSKEKVTTVIKIPNAVENRAKSHKKSLAECDMGYDIIQDIKKTKKNISLFEMCNLPQQRRNFLEAFDPQPNTPQDDIQSNKEINEADIGGESKSQTFPFLLYFEIFNHNVHNCLVDFRAS